VTVTADSFSNSFRQSMTADGRTHAAIFRSSWSNAAAFLKTSPRVSVMSIPLYTTAQKKTAVKRSLHVIALRDCDAYASSTANFNVTSTSSSSSRAGPLLEPSLVSLARSVLCFPPRCCETNFQWSDVVFNCSCPKGRFQCFGIPMMTARMVLALVGGVA